MLIIDLKTQQVRNDPALDRDVIVIKGASGDLMQSLSSLGCCSKRCSTNTVIGRKVPLCGKVTDRISKTVPTSIFANSSVDFGEAFRKISESVDTKNKKTSASFLNTPLNTREELLTTLVDLLTLDASFVEDFRKAVQADYTLNPVRHTVLAKSLTSAIALYVHYGLEDDFSSTEGVETCIDYVNVGTGTITSLANNFNILHKTGRLAQTRYSVSKRFEVVLHRILGKAKFEDLLYDVDGLQRDINNLSK